MLNSKTAEFSNMENCINRDTMYQMQFGFFMNARTF